MEGFSSKKKYIIRMDNTYITTIIQENVGVIISKKKGVPLC